MRKAKIVCTIGPASNTREMMERLLVAGMDVARLNFSHGTHAEHARVIRLVRELAAKHGRSLAILQDLQGPKIRTGALRDGKPIRLRAGQTFILTTGNVPGDASGVSISYRRLPREVARGDRILLADGLIELRVVDARGSEVRARVRNGGELGEHKGVNLPGVKLSVSSLTAKDRADLAFGLRLAVDYVALSFVRAERDVLAVKRWITRAGHNTPVIAKLEKPEAIENLDAILKVADGVMVARGDLGVEMSPEKVPVVQKRIIALARELKIPVITATQMLESMTVNPRPTRAEASDVANAVFDGTDALMLSAETASGRYPREAVEMMARIVVEAESAAPAVFERRRRPQALSVADAISESVVHATQQLAAKAIAVFTASGSTARVISKYRPGPPLVAFSPEVVTRQRLALCWGVIPRPIGPVRNIDEVAGAAEKHLIREGLCRPGDVIAIVAGTPLGVRGTTNFLKLHQIPPRRGK